MNVIDALNQLSETYEYVTVFDAKTGALITSYCPQAMECTAEDLAQKAAADFPGQVVQTLSAADWRRMRVENLRWIDGKLQSYTPTAEETAAEELAALDGKYRAQVEEKNEDIIEAVTVLQDEALAEERRQERAALVAEYAAERQKLVEKYKEA